MTRRDLQNDMREKKRPWDIGKSFAQAAPIGPIHPVSAVGHARARQDLARRQRRAPAAGRSRGHDLGRPAHDRVPVAVLRAPAGRSRLHRHARGRRAPSSRAIVSTAASTASERSRSPSSLRSPEVARWPPSSRPKKSSAATTIAPRFPIIRAGSRTTPRRRRRRARRSRRRSTCATGRGRRRRSTSSCRRDARKGTFVFWHGGYWRALDKSDFSFVALPFVAQGHAVAVVNYDLCPDVSIATIVDESRRAMAWLAREGARARRESREHRRRRSFRRRAHRRDAVRDGLGGVRNLPRSDRGRPLALGRPRSRADGAVLVQHRFQARRRARRRGFRRSHLVAAVARAARARGRRRRDLRVHPANPHSLGRLARKTGRRARTRRC